MGNGLGGATVGAQQATVLGSQITWQADLRNSAMSGAAHAMYLARGRGRGLFWALMVAFGITYAAGSLFTVYLGYRHGAVNMDPWFFGNSPRLPWEWAASLINQHKGPAYPGLLWMAAGAAVMAGLVIAQRTLFWWPIHPVALLICHSHMVTFFWISVFIAWLAKVLLLRIGGNRAYRPGRRFAIGMVMGYFLAGGIWAIIDTITGTHGNSVFYI